MPNTDMKKYRIEGLDCARCADKIETELRRIDGFDKAAVSFGTASMVIPADGIETARRKISEIEPEARIVEQQEKSGSRSRVAPRRITRISAALMLGVIGIIFRENLHNTPYHTAEYAVFLTSYLLVGAPVLLHAARSIRRGRVFDEMFLMSIATIGAILIHELPEAVAVMLFYSVGELVQDRAVDNSRRSIASLMDLRPDSARVVSGSRLQSVPPESVEIGSIIEVRPGERIPLDGEIIHGATAVDTSALTGESAPRTAVPGDTVLAGFVSGSGTIRIQVSRRYADSSVSRILELVEDAAARKAPTEKFISKFAAVYTPIIVGIAAAIAFLPPLLITGAALGEWVYRALVVLVISCPCALVISVPLGYFGGIGSASRQGILIKGANYIDMLKDVSTVVLDKTGTITKGAFKVTKIVPRNGFDQQKLLHLAVAAEAHSAHPIAASIRDAYEAMFGASDGAKGKTDSLIDVHEEKGYGITAAVNGRRITVGSDRLLRREQIAHADFGSEETAAGTVVYAAVDGTYAGYIVIADEVKAGAAQAVSDLRSAGVDHVVMLTGDNERTARLVAEETGIDTWYAGLLPEEKVGKVNELAGQLPSGKRLAFAGDGINDAPVLMRADIGFAMGALGSDAAIEAADVVLMDDDIGGIADAVRIARFTRSVVLQNIAGALLVKAAFLGLGAVGMATMWEAVIADVGVSLLAVLNAARTLRFTRRNPGNNPQRNTQNHSPQKQAAR